MKNHFRYALIAGSLAATVFSLALLGFNAKTSENMQVKADPNEATVVFDASHRLTSEQIESSSFHWPTSSGGFVAIEFQSVGNTPNIAPEGAFYSLTSTEANKAYQFFLRFSGIKGLKTIAWDISTTESEAGAGLMLWERSVGYGSVPNAKNLDSKVFTDPSGTITDFAMSGAPYFYELRISNIPVGKTVTINSLTLTYDIDVCKA